MILLPELVRVYLFVRDPNEGVPKSISRGDIIKCGIALKLIIAQEFYCEEKYIEFYEAHPPLLGGYNNDFGITIIVQNLLTSTTPTENRAERIGQRFAALESLSNILRGKTGRVTIDITQGVTVEIKT